VLVPESAVSPGPAVSVDSLRSSDSDVLLTTGHTGLETFLERDDCHFVIRLIETPALPIPQHAELLRTRPPYALADELALMQRHGFAVNVQHDFQIATDTTTSSDGFVWLRRILAQTRREFFVYYRENANPSTLTPEWIYAKHDSLTREHLRGNVRGFVRIDYRRTLKTRQTDVLGRYGYKTRGLWHFVQPTEEEGEFMALAGGGPFLTYAFYDRPSDRIYLLHGSVFAPEFEKLRFIRQMEVMANTFRTKADQSKPDSATVASTE